MTKNDKPADQRKYERFDVELGSFAVFSPNVLVTPGYILDISLGGLSFFYYDGEEWSDENDKFVNLFGEDIYLENVPLETVSDFEIIDDNHPIYEKVSQLPFDGKIRRRGMKFGKLSKEQRATLEEFIKQYYAQPKK
ncbi:MAG: PilZ domain-containing protein [Proteobacteria bacterium]|nr:PilZ domain-containing protein [Pseudomonadota bacterium]MBU1709018.1 PilZ domain-containing protein [Pseudomonadota bacterium]